MKHSNLKKETERLNNTEFEYESVTEQYRPMIIASVVIAIIAFIFLIK